MTSAGKSMEKSDCLYTVGGIAKFYSHYVTMKPELPYDQAILLLGVDPKKMRLGS